MYGILDISTSGMIAQRTRLDVAAANIANKEAILDSSGNVNPYRARRVMFAPGNPGALSAGGRDYGVHVAQIDVNQGPPRYVYDPSSPYAIKSGQWEGYVPHPDINTILEVMNGRDAERAYEANAMVAEATKSMMAQALRLIA
ncbi:MAG: flagellar basal body rod protein FlgC [Phycisphaeraceae bacterium]|jgi:flagellar basal-body rod protein FlgC|nr:flagellar basal body rod protein FlgC [Phycisphaeraceae bacterium]